MSLPNKLHRRADTGSVLLEALIAILIFSIGILAVIGLQAMAVQASSEAKYRVDASLLAAQLIEQMRVSNRSLDKLKALYASPDGEAYLAWKGSGTAPAPGTVQAALPGAAAYPPTVTIVESTQPKLAGRTVTITIYWKTPQEPAASAPHRYVSVTQVI